MANTKVSSEQIIDGLALGGNPTAATQTAGNNSTRIATTAYTDAAITALIGGAPSTLDTLNEIAAAVSDDPDYVGTVNAAIALKAPKASPTFTGVGQFDSYGGTSGKGRIQFGNSGQQFIEGMDTGNGGSGSYLKFGYGSTNALTIASTGAATFASTVTSTGLTVDGGGSIGVVNTDRLYIATADGLGLQLDKDNNRIIPCDAAGAYNNNVELGDSSLEFTNLWLSGTAHVGAVTSTGAISAVGSANSSSASHIPALLGSGSYGGGIATRDGAESGWYQQSSGADWHFYHNRTVASQTPESKKVLSFNSTGAATFTSTDDARVYIKDTGDSSTILIRGDGANSSIGNDSNHPISFTTNGTARLTISNSGNISTHPPAGNHFVINEDGVDSDFRVESDGHAHALFVDGGANDVLVGYNSPNTGLGAKKSGTVGFQLNSPGVDDKGGHLMVTQLAVQNTWMTIVNTHDYNATGALFLIHGVRTIDQNRSYAAMVRYAYQNAFNVMSSSQQNTTIEYRVQTGGNLQYRFTSAGPYIVNLTVMAAG
jgi:hypothetical protein